MIEASPSAHLSGMLALGTTLTHDRGGDLRRFYTNQHQCYCGIDLHARSMDCLHLESRWGNLAAPQHENGAGTLSPGRGPLA